MRVLLIAVSCGALLLGCARLTFNPAPQADALLYFDPVPYLYVSTTKDCVSTATLISLPGAPRSVSLTSGYGSANLTVSLKDGMISSVGQNTDTKIPETITALTGAAKAFAPEAPLPAPAGCKPAGHLYLIENGMPGREIPLPQPQPAS